LTGRAPCHARARPWRSSAWFDPISCFLAAAIVARQGRDPRLFGQAGLGRAAHARRAIERDPRPFGEEPLKRWLIFNSALLIPTGNSASHHAQRRQGRALQVGLDGPARGAAPTWQVGRQRFKRAIGSVIERSDYGEHRNVRRTSARHWRRTLEPKDRACTNRTVEVNALRLHRARPVPQAATPWTAAGGLACVGDPCLDG
jgi:hypothetical protein